MQCAILWGTRATLIVSTGAMSVISTWEASLTGGITANQALGTRSCPRTERLGFHLDHRDLMRSWGSCARTSVIPSIRTALKLVAPALGIRAHKRHGRALLLHGQRCLSQTTGKKERCLGMSPGRRTDLVHEQALPQLSGFPLLVVLGKTTTSAQVAPSVSTQCDCMEVLPSPSGKSPVQMGFC